MVRVYGGHYAIELRGGTRINCAARLLIALHQPADLLLDPAEIGQGTVHSLEESDDTAFHSLSLCRCGGIHSAGELVELTPKLGEPLIGHLGRPELVQREPLGGREQLAGIEYDDGPAGRGDDSGDVRRG